MKRNNIIIGYGGTSCADNACTDDNNGSDPDINVRSALLSPPVCAEEPVFLSRRYRRHARAINQRRRPVKTACAADDRFRKQLSSACPKHVPVVLFADRPTDFVRNATIRLHVPEVRRSKVDRAKSQQGRGKRASLFLFRVTRPMSFGPYEVIPR